MNRRFKRLTALFLFPILLVLVCPFQVSADDYNYTIRIFSGNHGTINGSEVYSTDLNYNDHFNFNINSVQVKDGSKYYVRGLKEAGKDNDYTILPSFEVTEDKDLVVAYGLLKDAVEYTVNYIDDATGEALADSVKFYGNIGDRPVVAHIYFEGYQPQAYNLTGTLTEDPAHNVFTFRYRRIPAAVTPSNPTAPSTPSAPSTTTPSVTRPATGPGTDTGNDNQDTGTDNEDTDTDDNAADNQEDAGNEEDTNAEDENQQENDRPNEIEDIDEPEVPLSGPDEEGLENDPNAVSNADKRTFFTPLNIILILIIIGAIGGIAFLIMKKKDLNAADDTVDYNVIEEDENDEKNL